ncbi:tRNA wybutosine-synthesizing protein 3 homolog [Cyrtonyx montezumae]|uniref:tRNA wybutosine-synthesizing protein 3 homolog n=1 Tax=Cyrtonyx montezumae TaxID=9017 RepID=UPI0032DAEC5F
MAAFGRWKAQRMARADCSRRGALDERAVGAVRLLNGRAQYCTTSSCSGRLVLAEAGAAVSAGTGAAVPKKHCRWLLVTHEPCGRADVMAALEKATGDVVFKFEPFVLHVLCQELQDAQLLHSVAMESGFKNSGITVGRGGKIMMAVRSTHCLEVPLSHMGKLMVSEEYIEFLLHVANQKMEENARRIDRFCKNLEAALEAAGSVSSSPSTEPAQVHAAYVRRRKRRTARVQGVLPPPEDCNEELEPGEDPEGSLDIFAGITL